MDTQHSALMACNMYSLKEIISMACNCDCLLFFYLCKVTIAPQRTPHPIFYLKLQSDSSAKKKKSE